MRKNLDRRVLRCYRIFAPALFFLLPGCAGSGVMQDAAPTNPAAQSAPDASPGQIGSGDARNAKNAEAPGKVAAGASAHCAAGASLVSGPYKYDNNQWGRAKAKGPFEQCLLERSAGQGRELGWTWFWPGADPSVFAYPEIIFGLKPWGGGTSDPRFPMRVADVEHLLVHYEVETEATGSYNLAPELWLIDSGEPSGNPRTITTEIMFWMEHTGSASPAGSVVDRPTYGGIEYALWRKENMGDRGDGSGWLYYALVSPMTQRKGSIPVHVILADMVKAGRINPEHYVAGVEFGNEIIGGSGTTWVKRFEVETQVAQ